MLVRNGRGILAARSALMARSKARPFAGPEPVAGCFLELAC